jgi:hypothetical protein
MWLSFIWLLGFLVHPGPVAGRQTDHLYTRRFAFLVGSNNGGNGRVVLRYAVEDARAIGRVLEEMGGILPGDSRFLEEPGREDFFREFMALSDEVNQARERHRRVEVILYYSGHSDEADIFLGEDRVSYKEFRDLITALNADVRIAIIDSCASGALTLPKGVTRRSPFLLDSAYDMKGYAFMTSSSASEAAQESSRLRRSFFTHNLISGMRGGADMNQDGRITLNEAYQFAFDGTLTQTEKTMAGPQHPAYHIQMAGTGDVVITEIRNSAAVLVIKNDLAGKTFIHGRDNALVVELDKPAGREISIGLEAGEYRIIHLDSRAAWESRISLENGKNVEIGRAAFSKTNKIPTQIRGIPLPASPEILERGDRGRWRVEVFGGFGTANAADLNLRASFEEMSLLFYGDDYFQYQLSRGEIASFTRANAGGKAKLLKHAIPVGFRVHYGLAGWLNISLGLTRFAGARESSFKDTYDILEKDGTRSSYWTEFKNFKLAADGYVPSVGLHLRRNLVPALDFEAFVMGGPLIADCLYSLAYDSQWPIPSDQGDIPNKDYGILEEKGSGVGLALQAGAKIDFKINKRYGLFIEGCYAHQSVSDISGPGVRSINTHRDSWEGDWGLKQDIKSEPWGTARFLWPSNGWTIFGGTWWRARDFKLDLSGFQARIGLFYRF